MLSLPRSGSTFLTRLLDDYEDVVGLPESFFPQILEMVPDAELLDTRLMAARFIVSCSDGTPLTLDEAQACISKDRRETLIQLSEATVRKSGRDPKKISVIVWKSTRVVGQWQKLEKIGGKFLILEREPLNVYESQFRVPFGAKNHNPLRFALFAASYYYAFRSYPEESTKRISYSHLEDEIGEVIVWMGSKGRKRSSKEGNTLADVANRPWHSEITKSYQNNDKKKLEAISGLQRIVIQFMLELFRLTEPLIGLARYLADYREFRSNFKRAKHL